MTIAGEHGSAPSDDAHHRLGFIAALGVMAIATRIVPAPS
jgi:hypothetical protein